jgi:ethanolamine ammonia-lyase small subunit
MSDPNLPAPTDAAAGMVAAVRARTPARLLAGRAGTGYRTATALGLRRDHAAARDAVWAEMDLAADLGADLTSRFGVFEVRTRAADKQQYLLRPDLGRSLSDEARETLRRNARTGADLQIVLGDGLSAAAVAAQAPGLLPRLAEAAECAGLGVGSVFAVRYCRVGVINEIGELLSPDVVVLLIGERPGLATAESLSAYLAYRPRPGDTDARRNLISNIHARGVGHAEAVRRILALAAQMRSRRLSGTGIKEDLAALPGTPE